MQPGVVVRALLAGLTATSSGCGVAPDEGRCEPFVVDVASFLPGPGAGFGAEQMPAIVQGPPTAETDSSGSLDVVSLGRGGVITLEMGCLIKDVEGVDFVVYENAFFTHDSQVFGEAAEVAVSADGAVFTTFACTPNSTQDDGVNGCAGLAPVRANARNGLAGEFEDGGGDGFDLAALGVAEALFVRISDRSAGGGGNSVGFDLDAIAGVP